MLGDGGVKILSCSFQFLPSLLSLSLSNHIYIYIYIGKNNIEENEESRILLKNMKYLTKLSILDLGMDYYIYLGVNNIRMNSQHLANNLKYLRNLEYINLSNKLTLFTYLPN